MKKNIKLLLVSLIIISTTLFGKKIAKIPEASGICYIQDKDRLIVVNDEGWIYQVKRNGKIEKKVFIGKYDLEGIDYDKKNKKLLVIVEGKETILTLNRDNFNIEKKTKIKRKFKDIKLLKKSKNSGIEAIAIDENNNIYISNQSKIRYKKKLKKNSSVVFKINSIKKKKAKIVKVFNHRYIDIAGLTFYNGYLYMVSDKEDIIIKYDINKNKTIKKIKLPKYAQEGLCFDSKNNIYIADDDGNLFKYKNMF